MTIDFEYLSNLPFTNREYVQKPELVEKTYFELEKSGQKVTLLTGSQSSDFPPQLLKEAFLEFNHVIEEGKTYPFANLHTYDEFNKYLFEGFVAILVDESYSTEWDNQTQEFWHSHFLGYFYIKPNYVGRSSHVCNGGFVVNHRRRGLGLGKELGRKYLHYAPRLGFVYSVFNLVYETNVASWKIWDSLGFERIGYIKNVAVLRGVPNLVGAYVYGKDLQ